MAKKKTSQIDQDVAVSGFSEAVKSLAIRALPSSLGFSAVTSTPGELTRRAGLTEADPGEGTGRSG